MFGAFASAEAVTIGSVRNSVVPPKLTTVTESVCRNMYVKLPSGGSDLYSIDLTPYMSEPMDAIASRVFEAVIFMGPAQSSKTAGLIEGAIVYSIVDSHGDCLVIQTNQAQAEDFSKVRIQGLIERCPEVKDRLVDNSVHLKMFDGAVAIRFGWPSIAQVSGKAIKRVLLTDVDNFTGDLGILELFGAAKKRTQTFMSAGIVVAESSPAKDFADPGWKPTTLHEAPPSIGIAALFNQGDRRCWYWRCPECKEPFRAAAGIDGFVLPELDELKEILMSAEVLPFAEKYSRLVCPRCAVPIEHRWKRGMNRGGRWVGEGQAMHSDGTVTGVRLRTNTASFWLGGVAAGFQSWVSLVQNYLQAVKTFATTGDSRALKTTTNVDQAMPYLPVAIRAEENDIDKIKTRAEDLQKRVVPFGARFITAQIDVQKNGFVIQVNGWGPGLQWYVVDRYRMKSSRRPTGELDENGETKWFPIDPARYPEDWHRIVDDVIGKRYPLADESGREMPVRLVFSDSGGKAGVTKNAYDFFRYLVERGLDKTFRLVKGASTKRAPLVNVHWPDARDRSERNAGARGDVPVIFINTDDIKDTVIANATRATPGPGYMHFPKWLSDFWYAELFAEVRGSGGWENLHGRNNETLDLSVYGYAACLTLGADRIDWSNPPSWAKSWDDNPDLVTPGNHEPPKTAAPITAPRKVGGFRR